jgi:hypothetical protein
MRPTDRDPGPMTNHIGELGAIPIQCARTRGSAAPLTTRVGICNKQDSPDRLDRSPEPPTKRRASHRESRPEHVVCAAHPTPFRRGIWKDQQSSDGPRPLAKPSRGDRVNRQANLLVELAEGCLDGDQLRLGLDHQRDPGWRPPGKDVDRSSLSKRGVRHFHLHLPAERPQELDRNPDQPRMPSIEKPVQVSTTPGDVRLPSRFEGAEQSPHRHAGQARCVPTLHKGHRLFGQTGAPTQLALGH